MRVFAFTVLLLLITSACSVPQQEITNTARETEIIESDNTIVPIATEMFDSIHSATTAPTDTRSPVLTSPETEAAIKARAQPTRDPSEDESDNETEPTVGSTKALYPAKIYFLEASPTVLNAGDVTDLSWSASGLSAEICLVSSYTYFTDDDCQPVPVSGSLRFTVLEDLQPSYA
ncbi:MAG: hypothetical protein ACK2T3_02535, partial [Candidatus Promineifilaceae bacterium]